MNYSRGLIPSLMILLFMSCSTKSATTSYEILADSIQSNQGIQYTMQRAFEVVKTGFNAGDGYGEVWIRDYNTFIELSAEVYPKETLKENLRVFFCLQQSDGGIVDGFIPRSKAKQTKDGYQYVFSDLAPQYAGHKNNVETDQESSLVQAVYRYVTKTGDTAFLQEKIGDLTVAQRLEMAMNYLMNKRWSEKYHLIYGATTADWGDVQHTHPWGVFLTPDTKYSIDIYDNAMFLIAIDDMIKLVPSTQPHWGRIHADIAQKTMQYLWDAKRNKFIPHLYLDESPFPADFDENAIYYHGGTAVAIEAGLLSKAQVKQALSYMIADVKASGAGSIGLTLYPTYPKGYFENVGMVPYGYQNGGDWTWFGARMIQQLVRYGFLQEAYEQLLPMTDRVLANGGFFEWYTKENTPNGSGTFRGSAGVLYKAIEMLEQATGAKIRELQQYPTTPQTLLWKIGEDDQSGNEFKLAPDGYQKFIEDDFGWEDKYFLVGTSSPSKDWPYILPGTSDSWGGTWGTSGLRSNVLNILFSLDKKPANQDWILTIDLLDCNPQDLPLLKVIVNDKVLETRVPVINRYGTEQQLLFPTKNAKASAIDSIPSRNAGYTIQIPLRSDDLRLGGNEIKLTILDGSWVKFDQIKMTGPQKAKLKQDKEVYLRDVHAAPYEITVSDTDQHDFRAQPLIVDVEHLSGQPKLSVELDGEVIFSETVEARRYAFEAPMPAVKSKTKSEYQIFIDGHLKAKGEVVRTPQTLTTPARYVDTTMGSAHSRWMIAPGPWMPFSMVKLSPDNQDSAWQGGYDPIFESIGCFSHIHEWTLAGLGTMPANGQLITQVGTQSVPDSGYRSRINKETEEAPLGYYKVDLTDYNIKAEMTATTRCGFQRYTFPQDRDSSHVLLDLVIPAEYTYQCLDAKITQVSPTRIEGYSKQLTPNTWSGGISQEYTVYFVAEFDKPIQSITMWTDEGIKPNTQSLRVKKPEDVGAAVYFDTKSNGVVQMRTGISYVSISNASENLQEEIAKPFAWDFDAVRQANIGAWDELMQRVNITTTDAREKRRFYNSFYRSICSRNTYSDVNGQWRDADEKVRRMTNPDNIALGCDAFWNTFWNLNQFWNLVTPEWTNRWVNSELAMYDANGWLAKGPAGMEYIPVMVAEHEIPMIVGAYQMGIRDFDVEQAFQAVKKMQTVPGRVVGGGFAGNRDLKAYLKYHYVPYDLGRFSNSLEYAYDDWTVSQFAKAIGKTTDYETFAKRGEYWRNVIDPEIGYAHLKDSKGAWMPDYDPFKSGANEHFVEGNAWQLTYFVPQNIPGLAEVIGKKNFTDRLEWGFEESYKTRFNGINDQYWNYPVMQGNQQSMHFAYLFNWVDKPWLTQKWARAIMDRYYGYGVSNAYLGDEDQGQMSAWFLMSALGLFQTDGGCSVDPIYELGSPLYQKVVIDLGQRFGRGSKLVIEAHHASRLNMYIQSVKLNGKPWNDFKIPAHELLKGGHLVLEMGPQPQPNFGLGND